MKGATSFADKGLYLHALHNLGYEEVLNDILDALSREISNDDETGQDMKIYMINGLGKYSQETTVRDNTVFYHLYLLSYNPSRPLSSNELLHFGKKKNRDWNCGCIGWIRMR